MKTFASVILLAIATGSLAQQKETFDLAMYTPPWGWKKISDTADTRGYATTNNRKGTYCQVGFYKSMNSMGSPQLDFETEWQDLMAKPYNITAKPEIGISTAQDGWEAKSGVAPFDFNGSKSIAMLVTMSGFGKRMSIAILTNTEDYKSEIEKFLESVTLIKPEIKVTAFDVPAGERPVIVETKKEESGAPATSNGFAFNTTNFDNGWTSTVQADWVEVRKGNIKVLIHYPNQEADAYNSVVTEGLNKAWNILVAPRYSGISNYELKPITGWQTIEFGEADAVERATGQKVHVVLFKYNYSNGSGKYLEFITRDKDSFEREFGPYHSSTSGWENLENMATYNKFAVSLSDLTGKWTNDFSGALQYVNAYTGADAAMATHASNETFYFGPGNTYRWDLGVASGNVGAIKFQSVKSSGTFSLPGDWQVTFSDIEGKPRSFNAYFSCVKGARLLWLDERGFGRVE